MGQPRPLFHYFIFSNTHYNFYNTQMWNNVHPVNDAGIWTHNHWIVSLVFLFPSMLHFVANPLIRFFLFSLWASHKRVSVSLFLFQSYFFSSNHIFSLFFFVITHTQPSFRGRPHQTKNFLDLLNFSLCHCQSKLK